MSARVETFLARLYVDGDLRGQFLRDPLATARQAGLSEWECAEMAKLPPQQLETAANSFERKRQQRHMQPGTLGRLMGWLRKKQLSRE